jgi:ElaB/YqjD/DUF883 family membrane-anchored ribosome-binding protein
MSATDRRRADLERALADHRSQLSDALGEIRRSALREVAPSERMRKNPYPWLGAAAGLGLWLALRQP